MSSLDNTLASLTTAEETGAATEAKLKAQNEKLKKMMDNMEQMNANLEQSDESLGRMEAGYVSSKITGLKNTLGLAKPKLGSEAGKDLKLFTSEGWLEKRGPAFGYSFEKRWCKLLEDSVVWYVDSDCKEKKGAAPLTCRTRVIPFTDSSAPGDAPKHRSQMPYGFVLDADPDMGKRRRLFYFNASCDSELRSWAAEIAKAAKALEARAAEEDGMRVTPLSKMDEINNKLDVLKDRAVAINGQAQKQSALIKEVNSEVDKTTRKVEDLRARTKKI